MTTRRLAQLLTLAMFAYMAAFAALYLDKVMPLFRPILKALGH